MIAAGVRELKAKLSSYLDMVSRGERVVITEHGREVAIIAPVSPERKIVKDLSEQGKAHWSGGKPGEFEGVGIKGKPLSQTILEERE